MRKYLVPVFFDFRGCLAASLAPASGEVSERLKELVSKTSKGHTFVGSNPTLSAHIGSQREGLQGLRAPDLQSSRLRSTIVPGGGVRVAEGARLESG